MNTNTKGSLIAIVASVAYGLNPFFALPLYEEGLLVDSVLFYRLFFAMVFLGVVMLFRKQSFAIKKKEILPLISLGVLFAGSSFFLFDSFNYMDAGIACTILFVYPVIVAIIMAIFFKERASLLTYFCIALALFGIGMLYNGGDKPLSIMGMTLVLLSALSYSIYIIAVNKSAVRDMNAIKLTFWAMLFSVITFAIKLNMLSDLQPLVNSTMWFNIIGLSLIPTVIAMVLIAIAINIIGSTYTSIVGSLEPLTALFIGVFVFNEPITPRIIMGIILILVAVTLIVIGKPLIERFKRRVN